MAVSLLVCGSKPILDWSALSHCMDQVLTDTLISMPQVRQAGSWMVLIIRWLGSDHMQLEHTQGWSWATIRVSRAAASERTAFWKQAACSLANLSRRKVSSFPVRVWFWARSRSSIQSRWKFFSVNQLKNVRILVWVGGGVIGWAWVLRFTLVEEKLQGQKLYNLCVSLVLSNFICYFLVVVKCNDFIRNSGFGIITLN